jgi:nucleoid-associated protein YejK
LHKVNRGLAWALADYSNKDELSRKHGNTLIGTLRSYYGSEFAAGCSESDRLTDALAQLDEASLNNFARDYEAGKLAQIFPN